MGCQQVAPTAHKGLQVEGSLQMEIYLLSVVQRELQSFSHDQGDYIEAMHPLVLGVLLPARVFGGRREERLTAEHLVKLAQIVEAECRPPLFLQAPSDLNVRMQIAQEPI